MRDLLNLTAAQAVAAIKIGEADASELHALYRERAGTESINSYVSVGDAVTPESVDAPLAGVPIAVKDLFCVEGIETRACSKILTGYIPPYTATAISKLQEAGASYLGKTNMDEFAMGSSNENSAFGAVRNPWDESRVPGGSSGGSAAAVAAGLAPWATGTDTGGSIRQPAAFCGLVGLKPTYGAISRYGMIAFASSLDQAGPITRDVTDAALMLKYMQGKDEMDSTSTGMNEDVATPSNESLAGKKFAIPAPIDWSGVQSGVKEVFDIACKRIEALGGELTEVPLPHADYALSAYYVIAPAEASANLSRFDGVRFGERAADPTGLTDMYERTRGEGFGPEVKRRIMLGTYALSSGYYDAYYNRAQQVRTKILEDYAAAFANCDFIITPTAPSVAFGIGEKIDDPLSMYLGDLFTVPVSLAGLPAISVPAGLATSDGSAAVEPDADGALPVGLQIVAPHFKENALLDAAYAFEKATDFADGPWTWSAS
ncbi:MAG: Asp-tRNA(Asn)/Glu-tRNA(Gln) amidotransferase subunit GatA [Solirubrobacterales bacterium]|nr:Asp-tRNA(Asn)/Glu-tRNA(Gln) amidotransferase subunit GatA [Solirubrobacterales bacterium]